MSDSKKDLLVTAGGSVAGAAGGIGGVVAGAATGTSGAVAITSGLSAVGSVVGGGMLAGLVTVAAAPIAGGAAAYGLYRLFKK
ncbi:hypothetical protein [Desulfonatronum thiodismutans]|uniref:hypothetical protein n=1 Tax=Desulfonatronum thiodismutans TaxID=159290 RepID=UPI000A013FDC|nr:hypothetical protein [Desulfonatronum thiodismutans]